jgi:hypothetical protein
MFSVRMETKGQNKTRQNEVNLRAGVLMYGIVNMVRAGSNESSRF